MQQLHDSFFLNVFDQAAIGMALVALDGKCLRVNRSLCTFLGYSEEELLHRTFQEITYRGDLEEDLSAVGRLLRGEASSYQLLKRYYHKSGRVVWGDLSVSLVRDENGEPVCFASQVQDATAQKEAEQDRDALMSLPLAFPCIIGFDGYAHRVNYALAKEFGYSVEELQTTSVFEFIHADDREATRSEMAGMAEGGETRLFQNRVRRKDGTYRWLLWSGIGLPERRLFYVIGTDITRIKASEEAAAREAAEKERLMFDLDRSSRQIRALQEQLITVCAWTRRIRYAGEWMSAEDFLTEHVKLTLTHGMSEEAAAQMMRAAEE